MKNHTTRSDQGNLFLAIFGAIALAGILGGGVIAFSKGPVQKAITLTKKNSVEAEMSILGQLAIMAATNQANKGDCDGDAYVEPPEWRLVSGTSVPTNGGLIPNTIGASKIDPWGTQYGYCVWDSGPLMLDAACQASPGVIRRLQGNDSRIYPVIAVISAGADKTFTTTCRNFSIGADKADQNGDGDLEDVGDYPLVAKAAATDDDVIFTYTYEGAMATAGGLWKLKSTDATTAYLNKKIEAMGAQILGTGTFERMVAIGGDFVDVISGLKLPSASQMPTCNVANTNVFRRSVSSMGLEICDGTSWVAMGGGSASSSTIDGFADGITNSTNYFIGQGAANSSVSGTKNTAVGMKTLSAMTSPPGSTAFGIEAANKNTSPVINAAGYRAAYNTASTGASANTVLGAEAHLGASTGGFRSTAVGYRALKSIGNVGHNTAVGSMALMSLNAGSRNTAAGFEAGKTFNGLENTLIGYQAGKDATTLRYNTVVGSLALSGTGASTRERNVAIGAKIMTAAAGTGTANDNVAIGSEALRDLASGSRNTAMGYRAGQFLSNQNEIVAVGTNTGYYGSDGNVSVGYDSQYNATGARNTAVTFGGANNITSGTDNTTFGYNTNASTGSHNTAIGYLSMTSSISGSRNTALGAGALYTAGDDNVGIGDGSFRNATSGAPSGTTFVGGSAGSQTNTSNNATAVGMNALTNLTTGTNNTAFGSTSLRSLVSGGNTTALGFESGLSLTGNSNTALGRRALRNNITGSENVAIGNQSMQNTGDGPNTCIGVSSCNYAGPGNTAIGGNTLLSSTYGASNNVAVGFQALTVAGANATLNTSIGVQSQKSLVTGQGNTSVGMQTMFNTVTSNATTAIGQKALYETTVSENVAVGYQSLGSAINASENTAFGGNALSAVSTAPQNRNTAFGYNTLSGMSNTSSANNAVMGNVITTVTQLLSVTVVGQGNAVTNAIQNSTALGGAAISASNTIRFGNTAITTINGQVAFTVASDKRLKRDIHPTDLGLDFILKLKPVSYRLIDGNGKLDYGFLAQDVEQALEGRKTNMVTRRNDEMRTYKMRPDDLIAPLVRAVQEQQEMLEKLEKEAESLN